MRFPAKESRDPTCPRCGQGENRVLDTRRSMAGSVKRIRRCVCGARFTTYEQANTAVRFRALFISLGIGRDVSS